jgi:hypothetical protein
VFFAINLNRAQQRRSRQTPYELPNRQSRSNFCNRFFRKTLTSDNWSEFGLSSERTIGGSL